MKIKQVVRFFCFLSYTLIFITQAYSNQATDSFEQLDQFNQPNFGIPTEECQNCLQFSGSEDEPQPNKESDPLLYQCAVDLCGPSEKSPRYTFLNNTTFDMNGIDPEITRTFDEKIRPAIEEAVDNQMSHRRRVLADWGQLMRNFDTEIKEQEWDDFARALTPPIGRKVDWDENKNPVLTYFVYDYFLEDMDTVEKKGVMSYLKSKNEAPSIAGKIDAIKYEGNNTTTDASDKVATLLREQYQRFLAEYNSKYLTKTENEYVQWLEEAMASDSTLNKNDGDIGYALDNLIKKGTNHSFCSDKDCRSWVRDEITGLHQGLEQGVQNQADYTAQYIKYCRSIYTANILNTRKTREYRENLPEYINQFFNSRVFANYSRETRRAIETDIKGKEFTLPPSEDDMQSYFIDYINNQNESQNKMNEYSMQSFTTILDEAADLRNNDNFGFCPDIREQFSKDRASGRVSLFSCTFHEHGEQILAHEFGHALSSWFKKNNPESNENTKASKVSYTQYTTLRECANSRHTTEERSGYVWPNDKLRTEEDTADLIAHFAFSNDSISFMCSLLKTSPDGLKYQDESIAIINPDDTDTHSARLLRVIMEAIHKRKKLSSSCQKVVDTYKDEINFEPCF